MAKAGARKVESYGDRFKATAVKLSKLPGVRVQDVAAALDIHPFMLSLWRKQVREGVIVARAAKLDVETTAELRRLRELVIVKQAHDTFWGGYAGDFQDPDAHPWEVAWNPQWIVEE